MTSRKSFLRSLGRATELTRHYAFIDAWATEGNAEGLRELFHEILEGRQPHVSPTDWTHRALLERIVDALALSEGDQNASTALELALSCEQESGRYTLAGIVSKIAFAQSSRVIDRLLWSVSDLESSALILQEAVVRGKLVASSATARDVADRITRANHPLSILPIRLLDIEAELLLPNYGLGSSARALPFGPLRDDSAEAVSISGDLDSTETTTHGRQNQIIAAVQNWVDESNGKIEARTFRASARVLEAIGSALPNLGLASVGCCENVLWRDDVPASDVFSILFSAASGGGAYNTGRFGAYGRLLAWRSLGGLTGCAETTSLTEISNHADKCRWGLFDSMSGWYHHVAWDIGITCGIPAARELAVLAATDTD